MNEHPSTPKEHTYDRAARFRLAYQDGKDAWRNGLPESANPYKGEFAGHWRDGYTDAGEGI